MRKKSIPKPQPRTRLKFTRDKGDWAEMRFMAEATRRGLIVSRPYGAVSFDFIVCTRKGPLYRIQVKSSWSLKRGMYPIRTCHGTGRPYRSGEVDFIVGYVAPEDVWYIVPFSDIPRGMVYVAPHLRDTRSRWEKFREAWGLLRGEEPGYGFDIRACADPNAIPGIAEIAGIAVNTEEVQFPAMDADLSGCYVLERMMVM